MPTESSRPRPESATAPFASLRRWLESPWFQNVIVAVIIVNAVTLGLETVAPLMERYGDLLRWLDRAALIVFVAELLLKLLAYRSAFFRNGWNLFDFSVVLVTLLPTNEGFAVLRSLRILRALRLVSVVPSMRKVVSALLSAVPGLMSVISLLMLVFYVSAVMSTKLFGAQFPDWFGSLGASFYTLFQIMTLESWSMGIARPVMEVHPFAWIFFVAFILFTTFVVLNLFIAIIVDAMNSGAIAPSTGNAAPPQAESSAAANGAADARTLQMLQDDIQALRRELAEWRQSQPAPPWTGGEATPPVLPHT